MYWVTVMLEDPSMTQFKWFGSWKEVSHTKTLWYMDPSIIRWFCTKKQSQSMMFPPRCLAVECSWGQSQHFSSSKWVGFTWAHHVLPSFLWVVREFIGKLQTGVYMCLLKQAQGCQGPLTYHKYHSNFYIIVSGQTYKISRGSNNYFPHSEKNIWH